MPGQRSAAPSGVQWQPPAPSGYSECSETDLQVFGAHPIFFNSQSQIYQVMQRSQIVCRLLPWIGMLPQDTRVGSWLAPSKTGPFNDSIHTKISQERTISVVLLYIIVVKNKRSKALDWQTDQLRMVSFSWLQWERMVCTCRSESLTSRDHDVAITTIWVGMAHWFLAEAQVRF